MVDLAFQLLVPSFMPDIETAINDALNPVIGSLSTDCIMPPGQAMRAVRAAWNRSLDQHVVAALAQHVTIGKDASRDSRARKASTQHMLLPGTASSEATSASHAAGAGPAVQVKEVTPTKQRNASHVAALSSTDARLPDNMEQAITRFLAMYQPHHFLYELIEAGVQSIYASMGPESQACQCINLNLAVAPDDFRLCLLPGFAGAPYRAIRTEGQPFWLICTQSTFADPRGFVPHTERRVQAAATLR